MRQLNYGTPDQEPKDEFEKWTARALDEIQDAADEDIEHIFDEYTVSNYTVTRTLDAGAATASDIADVLCTIIQDIKNRGTKR